MKWNVRLGWKLDGWLHYHVAWAWPAWAPLCHWLDRKLTGEES